MKTSYEGGKRCSELGVTMKSLEELKKERLRLKRLLNQREKRRGVLQQQIQELEQKYNQCEDQIYTLEKKEHDKKNGNATEEEKIICPVCDKEFNKCDGFPCDNGQIACSYEHKEETNIKLQEAKEEP